MSDDLSIPNPENRSAQVGRYGTGRPVAKRGMDPDMRRMGLFAGGIAVVLVGLIGASALTGHRSTEVPVISAENRPIRVKPENPGGLKIDTGENDAFTSGSDTSGAKLTAPAETPDTRDLRSGGPSSPSAAPPPPARPAVTAIAPSTPAMTAIAPSTPAVTAGTPPTPATKPPPPATVATGKATPAATGKLVVQLAAVSTEQAARNEWQLLTKKLPDLLNGHEPSYSRIDRDGRTFWRLRTSGFADAAQARGFCEHVKAKGASCSVADF